jgi:cysteine-rich repeat protein
MSAVADRLLGHVVVVVAAALVLLALAAPGSLGRPTPPMCGNQVIERSETCDDENLLPGDGCSQRCRVEAVKGAN